jgi:hypothetical protein
MPGQIPLETKYYPADFDTRAITLAIGSSGSGNSTTALFYADRDLIIDQVNLFVVPGVAIATNAVSLKIKQTNGAVPTFATTSQDVGSFTALAVGTTVLATAFQTLTFTKTSPSTTPNNNVVLAGSVVWFQTEAAGSITNNPTAVVQVRFRTQF